MDYIAGTKLGLPVTEMRELYPGLPKVPVATGETTFKNPGDLVSEQELLAHGQTTEQIAELRNHGSLLTEEQWREANEDA